MVRLIFVRDSIIRGIFSVLKKIHLISRKQNSKVVTISSISEQLLCTRHQDNAFTCFISYNQVLLIIRFQNLEEQFSGKEGIQESSMEITSIGSGFCLGLSQELESRCGPGRKNNLLHSQPWRVCSDRQHRWAPVICLTSPISCGLCHSLMLPRLFNNSFSNLFMSGQPEPLGEAVTISHIIQDNISECTKTQI